MTTAIDNASFGWIAPFERTPEQHDINTACLASMPAFDIVGKTKKRKSGDKALLYEARQQVSGKKDPPYVWQSTGSCFPAGTPVRTADGEEKPIEKIIVGDEVITHTGQARCVVETMRRNYSGEMITVSLAGFPYPLTMTADHPVAVMRSNANWRWQPDRLEWVDAGELTEDDRMLIGTLPELGRSTLDVAEILGESAIIMNDLMEGRPTNLSRECVAQKACRDGNYKWKDRVRLAGSRHKNAIHRYIRVTPSFARLLGLYLAEGGCCEKRVTFTLNANEEHLADEIITLIRGIFGAEAHKYWQKSRASVLKVRVPNWNVATVFNYLIPGNIYTKRVPGVIMRADNQVRIAALLGWLDGDGYAAMHRGSKPAARIQGVSAAPGLSRDMTILALSCGIQTSSSKRKPRKQSGTAFDVFLSGPKILEQFPTLREEAVAVRKRPLTDTDTNRTPFGYCRKVNKISVESVDSLQVFDFEVEEDHSFIAGGLVVHNCVGAGGCNALMTLRDIEITLGEPEQPKEMWWPFTYGESREIAGMRGRGDGSFGSAWAKAITQRGIFAADVDESLPKFQDRGGWYYLPSSTEYAWSDGYSIPNKWNQLGKEHLVKTAAKINNADEAAKALQNGYPLTCASMFGTRGPRVQGDPPVSLAEWDAQWPHQMFVHAWWHHPTLGEIFYIGNNWGPNAHGRCPSGAPLGGFWVRKTTFNRICQDEVFALSAFDGFPARELWYDIV